MERGVRIQDQDSPDGGKRSLPSSGDRCHVLKDFKEKHYIFSCARGMGIISTSCGSCGRLPVAFLHQPRPVRGKGKYAQAVMAGALGGLGQQP